MKPINRKSLDDLIRIARKYWGTGDVDFLAAIFESGKKLSKQAFDNEVHWCNFCDAVSGVIKLNPAITNETICQIFSLVGICFVDTKPEGLPA